MSGVIRLWICPICEERVNWQALRALCLFILPDERIGSSIFLYSLANDEGWALMNTEKLLRFLSAVAVVDRGVFSHVKTLIGGYRALWRQKKLYILLLKSTKEVILHERSNLPVKSALNIVLNVFRFCMLSGRIHVLHRNFLLNFNMYLSEGNWHRYVIINKRSRTVVPRICDGMKLTFLLSESLKILPLGTWMPREFNVYNIKLISAPK